MAPNLVRNPEVNALGQNYFWIIFNKVLHWGCQVGAITILILHIKQLKAGKTNLPKGGFKFKQSDSRLPKLYFCTTWIIHVLSRISLESHPELLSGTKSKTTDSDILSCSVLTLGQKVFIWKDKERIISKIRPFSLIQAIITEFILVKSTFDRTPLYNNQQHSLYSEEIPGAV